MRIDDLRAVLSIMDTLPEYDKTIKFIALYEEIEHKIKDIESNKIIDDFENKTGQIDYIKEPYEIPSIFDLDNERTKALISDRHFPLHQDLQ